MLIKSLLSLVAITASVVSARFVDNSLKVMSFNVRTSNAKDPCPAGCWELRKERARKVLAKYNPDLFGTQETAVIQTQFFQDTLGYAAVGECAGDCGSNERNSIFYRRDKWLLMKNYTSALSDTPEILGSNTWNLEYLREAVIARFLNKHSGDTVCMLNTHYDITRGQNESSVLVAKHLADFCEPFDTVIMTGDLNTWPSAPAVQYLLNNATLNGTSTPIQLYEALTAAGAGGKTWIGPSFGNVTVWNKIDYIFARNAVSRAKVRPKGVGDAPQTCLQAGQVIVDTFEGGYTSSDHALVMSTFCTGSPCSGCLPTFVTEP